MKDRVARQLIAKLLRCIQTLDRKIAMLENPHPKDCKCDLCSGYVPDYSQIFTIEEQEALKEVAES